MKRLFSNLIIFLSALAAVSCADDRMWADEGVVGEGEANIKATIGFKSFDPALRSRISGGTDGTILDALKSFTVLIYNQDGTELIDRKDFPEGSFTPDTNTQQPGDGDGVEQPVSTPKTTFDLTLPYGKYKAYIVGNANLEGKDVSNETALQNITYEWQSDIADNNQMFGWFSSEAAGSIKANTFDDNGRMEAPVLTINKPGMTLTAWLVRLASKVTIAYDATNLKTNVFIFLKSATIKDIPTSCALGVSNTPTSKDQLTDGQTIIYYNGTKEPTVSTDFNVETYPAVLSTDDTETFGSSHAHNDEHALFFYENNQGEGKDKRQDAVTNSTIPDDQIGSDSPFNEGSGSSDGEIDFPDGNSDDTNTGFKDEKRFGTYIEVEAYYRSNNTERLGEGKIIYRFMLGQDVLKNYDAKRNYHYKLTLKFNGFANDVDWHIDYTPDPGIYVPSPYYISYLYDKTMDLPVRVTGEFEPGTKLEAKVIKNEWMPYDYNDDSYPYDQYYNPNNGELNPSVTDAEYNTTQHECFGFLTLTNPGVRTQLGGGSGAGQAYSINQSYWTINKQGQMEYEIGDGPHQFKPVPQYDPNFDLPFTEYSVSVDENKEERVFTIPLFTRPKNLVKASGYTGNNPYVSYQRKAVIEFSASLKQPDGSYERVSEQATIIQVRRLVNPKGIWRDWNENKSFHVKLIHLVTEYTTDPWETNGEFKEFESIGPWSAEVIAEGGDNSTGWILLNGSTKKIDSEGGLIDFYYQPNGTLSDESKSRYGIIKVRYHNYTCEHLIFVRQGYAPIRVIEDGSKWYSFNMNTQSEMASSPCDEGSLFKRFRWDNPIDAVNNKDIYFQMPIPAQGLKLYGQDKYVAWNSWYSPKDATEWDAPTVKDKNGNVLPMRVASVVDYMALYNGNEIQQGYGILYDGNADGVQTSVKDAYSYYYNYQTGANGNGNGMRGCFVYNEKTGAQIFLPIGAAGYGRRRCKNVGLGTNGDISPGILAYANRNSFMPANVAANLPLLYDIFRRPGANYWTNEMVDTNGEPYIKDDKDSGNPAAWDFNYISFDFYPLSWSNVIDTKDEKNTDALRVRCVVDE